MGIVYVPHMPDKIIKDRENNFVCRKPLFNITPAKQFGEIEIILPGEAEIVFSPGLSAGVMQKKLKNFCDDDYLLAIGDPVAMIVAGHIAAKNNHGRVSILKWDRQRGEYLKAEFNI